jgi:hypothetical protein
MQVYSEFRPSQFDCKGLGCEDQQDWLVAPVANNRDADSLQRSNWAVVTCDLEKQPTLVCDEPDTEIHRFGHWANGWFEIMLVRPGSKAAECAQKWENSLADYPCASEDHWSDLQWQETAEYWAHLSISCRRSECERARVSKLEAYRPLGKVSDRLLERLQEGI